MYHFKRTEHKSPYKTEVKVYSRTVEYVSRNCFTAAFGHPYFGGESGLLEIWGIPFERIVNFGTEK
jgi:hypothetical protein